MSELEIVTEVDASNPNLGDIRVINGDINWLEPNDPKAVAQRIEFRLKSVMGDWYIDLLEGIPWFHEIIGEKGGEINAGKYIRKAIAETPGVNSVTKFETLYDNSTRVLSIEWTAVFVDNKIYSSDDFAPFTIKIA